MTSCCVLIWERIELGLWDLFYKVTNSIHDGFKDLSTSQRPHLLIPSRWYFNIWIWGNTNIYKTHSKYAFSFASWTLRTYKDFQPLTLNASQHHLKLRHPLLSKEAQQWAEERGFHTGLSHTTLWSCQPDKTVEWSFQYSADVPVWDITLKERILSFRMKYTL